MKLYANKDTSHVREKLNSCTYSSTTDLAKTIYSL